jgi:hypothetical protein
MTQDHSAGGPAGAGSPAVVEFGPASGPPDQPPPRRPALSRLLAGARLDDRAVPALAGLGAVAVFVSLVSPWQATVVDPDTVVGPGAPQEVSAGLLDLGSWGTGYLMAGFALAACVALVLFGAPAVRRHARVAGLGVGGALFAMVVALAVELSRNSVVYPVFYVSEQEPATSYRPGMYLAFLGAAALTVALYLAGRLPSPAQLRGTAGEGAAGQGAGEAGAAAAGAGEEGSLWRWRRPSQPAADPTEPPPPADLTVSPAAPFVRPVSGPGVRDVSGPGVRPVSGPGVRDVSGPGVRDVSGPGVQPVSGAGY